MQWWLKQQTFISRSSGEWKSRTGRQHGGGPARALFLPCRWLSSGMFPHIAWGERVSPLASLLIRAPPSWSSHLLKAHLRIPWSHRIGTRVSAYEFWQYTNIWWVAEVDLRLKWGAVSSFLICLKRGQKRWGQRGGREPGGRVTPSWASSAWSVTGRGLLAYFYMQTC